MTKAFVSIAKQQSESLSISKQQLEQNKLLLDALTRGVGSTRNNFSTQSSSATVLTSDGLQNSAESPTTNKSMRQKPCKI